MPAKVKSSVAACNRFDKSQTSAMANLQHELFSEGIVSRALLDAVPNPLLIINEAWQVVYANPAVRALVNKDGETPVKGLSVGEAFHCVHSRHGLQEAGNNACCRICGVARVLSISLKGEAASEDCHLACELTGAASNLDLRVWATPLEFHGERFSLLSLVDISDKFRREMLEKICFHDLLNTLSSIRGFLSIIKDETIEDQNEICDLLERTTQNSIDEIMAIRLLDSVVHKDLQVQPEDLESHAFMELMVKTTQRHPAADGKQLEMAESDSRPFRTDPGLLRRIISNMIINALEATPARGTVTLGCSADATTLRLWVHNDGLIAHDVRTQIFQKISSTKGSGRGVGTYSIKLLSEALGGEVYFKSTKTSGTVFSLLLKNQDRD